MKTQLRTLGAITAASLVAANRAWAQSAECAADPVSSACKLQRALHILYWLAGALTVVLIVVGLLAYAFYRRSRKSNLGLND